jgi:peptide/nickel transport system substrate-binding protein
MKATRTLVTLAALLTLATAAAAQETPRMGGVLKVATIGEPPSLDIPISTAVLTYEIMWHADETLFTYDAAFNPVPLLAETHAVTSQGLRHTITLRKGVKFHNGKETTAACTRTPRWPSSSSTAWASTSTSRSWTGPR